MVNGDGDGNKMRDGNSNNVAGKEEGNGKSSKVAIALFVAVVIAFAALTVALFVLPATLIAVAIAFVAIAHAIAI
jgi:hypothetical protein